MLLVYSQLNKQKQTKMNIPCAYYIIFDRYCVHTYIYGLVWFYGISIIVGYLMPNLPLIHIY